MKQARMILFMVATLTALAHGAAGASEDGYKPVEVMVLGTVHFRGYGDEFMSPDRQAQIEEVISRLAEFKPDKIMIELDHEREDAFNAKYQAYLAGKHALTVNERQQLGMRLAARLGHGRLYAVDFSSFLDYRPALQAAEELNQKRLLAERTQIRKKDDKALKDQAGLPLDELLIAVNKPELGGNNWALTIAQMGTVENPQGALQMTTFWERNLVIFARAAQYSEPGDKILLIFGYGHNYQLNQLFTGALNFKVVSPVSYLKGMNSDAE